MKITSIKYNSKENVFNLIIDDNEKYNLSYDLYESYKLFEEMTIDDDLYLIIKKYHIFYNAKKQTLKYAAYKQRTEKKIEEKLKSYNLDLKEHDLILNILKNSKLIDDYDFTKNYILNAVTYKKKSLNVVKYELKIKGISNFMIEDALFELGFNNSIEVENIKYWMEKFLVKNKNYDKGNFNHRQKLKNFLISKGFSYETINSSIF